MDKDLIQHIETVKRNNVTWLNLRQKKLYAFPEIILQCTNINSLQLGAANVIDNSNVRSDHKYWWETTMDDNRFDTLPESISLLNELTLLDCDQLGLRCLPQSIGKLSNLVELRLRNNNLTALPESFLELKNLEFLDISYNNFKEFPINIIKHCKKLQWLEIGSSGITKIPPEITELENLKVLDISNYLDKKVHDKVKKRFQLNRNTFTQLPDELLRMKRIERIMAAHTDLEYALKELLRKGLPFDVWLNDKEKLRKAFNEDDRMAKYGDEDI